MGEALMDYRGKRVLVTGAGGFIGSHLTEALARAGARTRAFIRYTSHGRRGWLEDSPHASEIEFVAGDLRDRSSVERAARDCEIIFHLGALIAIPFSYEAPDAYIDTNISGTLNVLEAARAGGAVMVHTSTSEVYGTAIRVPIDEDHPLQGQSPYSASKIGADKLVESYYRSFGTPVVTVRPFNTYGPRQSARAVIPTVISQALAGDKIRLGKLTPTRDFNYVTDTVAGFLMAAAGRDVFGQTLNFGSGREITIAELVRLVGELVGRPVRVEIEDERMRPEKSEVDRLLCDSTRARAQLGWAPQTTLEEGLRQTIAWVEANLDRFRVGDYVK